MKPIVFNPTPGTIVRFLNYTMHDIVEIPVAEYFIQKCVIVCCIYNNNTSLHLFPLARVHRTNRFGSPIDGLSNELCTVKEPAEIIKRISGKTVTAICETEIPMSTFKNKIFVADTSSYVKTTLFSNLQ